MALTPIGRRTLAGFKQKATTAVAPAELPIAVAEVIDRVAVSAEQQEVLERIVTTITIYVVQLEDRGLSIPAAAVAGCTGRLQQRLLSRGSLQPPTMPQRTRGARLGAKALRTITPDVDERLAAPFAGAHRPREERTFAPRLKAARGRAVSSVGVAGKPRIHGSAVRAWPLLTGTRQSDDAAAGAEACCRCARPKGDAAAPALPIAQITLRRRTAPDATKPLPGVFWVELKRPSAGAAHHVMTRYTPHHCILRGCGAEAAMRGAVQWR